MSENPRNYPFMSKEERDNIEDEIRVKLQDMKAYAEKHTPKLTGGRVNYYLVKVDHPQREEQAPYQAECEDIIQALGMDFNEGCLFKELWRSANARRGNGKPGHTAVYGAEKLVHYAQRILRRVKKEQEAQISIETTNLAIQKIMESDSWITWTGGERPVPALQVVSVRLRNGEGLNHRPANEFGWTHSLKLSPSDIVAYRLTQYK